MNRYPRRLIEVDLPIKRISAHARREKSIRHGHISTLHIWWARRPLAACRAVILASLWPDPAPGPDDAPCPPAFLDAARTRMSDWALKHAEKASAESFPRLKAIQDNPTMLVGSPIELRNALLDFIADFANWDNSSDKDYLEMSRALVQAAHEGLGGAPETRPLVVDPFAGGGSIPLEALRVGADAFASDLNPVAVLLNRVVLEYIPTYGQRLADEVRTWGDWIQREAESALSEFYPESSSGDLPIAYLWSRTIISEAPSGDDCPVEVPLLRSMWLAKASSQDRALRWQRGPRGEVSTEVVWRDYADGTRLKVRRPLLQIFTPTSTSDVEPGTVARGSATCPVTGFTTPIASVRRQLKPRTGGTTDSRLIAIRQTNPTSHDRRYRLPTQSDELAVLNAAKTLMEVSSRAGARGSVPDEPLPPAGGLGFRVQPYGMVQWGHLFAPRQQLALVTLSNLVNRFGQGLGNSGDLPFDAAIQTCMALVLARLTDFCSSLCTLNATGNRGVFHTFARQALPVVWDYMETAPMNHVGANWRGGVDAVVDTAQALRAVTRSGQVQMASAQHHPLPDDIASAVITDPPYYDAVPYADLSDYFYVWLKRTLPSVHQEFQSDLSPKDEECIVDRAKGKDRSFFETVMTRALHEARRVLRPDGIAVVVFAHKSTAGWEAQLQALVDTGWVVTGSWPIDTERPGRLRAQGSAALASSVHLVCRPRENADGSIRTEEVGDWRDVLAELPRRIHEWMPRMAAEGVVGADAVFACLGPALEVFSRYSRVEKASGESVTLKEYLEQVWAVVSTEALSMIFDDADAAGLEPDARLTAMWLWTAGSRKASGGKERNKSGEVDGDDGTYDDDDGDDDQDGDNKKKVAVKGFALEFDAARKIAQGLGIHLDRSPSIVEVKGDTARLLPVVERTPYLFGKDTAPGGASSARPRRTKQRKLFEELEAVEAAASGAGLAVGATARPRPGQTALDRVHQAMILFGANRGEALKQFLMDDGVGRDGRFWKLAQALSALYPTITEEKRWVDGVLARKKGMGL